MRGCLRTTLAIAAVLSLAACTADEPDAADSEAPATAPGAPGADTATRTGLSAALVPNSSGLVIDISVVDDGIVVKPDSIQVERGRNVRWRSQDSTAVWLVAFADGSPFRNQQAVFSGGGRPAESQAPIGNTTAYGAYKYWVFHPDGEGGYLQLDPKLVIIDDPGGGGADSIPDDPEM